MTAAYVDAVMNRDGRKLVDISLIESPDVPRIGVGEAIRPGMENASASADACILASGNYQHRARQRAVARQII